MIIILTVLALAIGRYLKICLSLVTIREIAGLRFTENHSLLHYGYKFINLVYSPVIYKFSLELCQVVILQNSILVQHDTFHADTCHRREMNLCSNVFNLHRNLAQANLLRKLSENINYSKHFGQNLRHWIFPVQARIKSYCSGKNGAVVRQTFETGFVLAGAQMFVKERKKTARVLKITDSSRK